MANNAFHTDVTAAQDTKRVLVVDEPSKASQKRKCKHRICKSNPLIRQCEHIMGEGQIAEWSELPDLIKKSVWELACDLSGTRLLESLLLHCNTSVQTQVLEQLRGRMWQASTRREANYVLQTCIEVLPTERLQLIIEEMTGRAVLAAQNRYAVRVLERLIEHCSCSQTAVLVDELLCHSRELCRHSCGNYIIQHILEYGSDAQRSSLITCILGDDILSLAKAKVGNHIVSCALAKGSSEEVQLLVAALMPNADVLARHHSGSFVARELKRAMKLLAESRNEQ